MQGAFFIGKKGENMTEINLMTSDQRLIAVQKVVIASGDVNSVQLKVVFDDAWNGFAHRTATFHTAEDSTKYEALLVDDCCVVPWEALQKPGTLFIGIRGAETDGDLLVDVAIKTSSLVKYKIEQGAENGQTTLTPSMDLFQQYLKAMDDKVDPFRADVYAQMDAKIKQHEEALANITEGHLLWENPDPTAEFAAQTIALDLSAYKKVVVLYAGEKGTRSTIMYSKGEDYEMRMIDGGGTSSTNTFARKISWNNSGVTIGTPGNSYDDECIPVKIIGFKSGGIISTSDDGGIEDDGFDL